MVDEGREMINRMDSDGEYVIFTLQYWDEKDGVWADAGLGSFGHPEGFNASGECWQRTGVHGTFDEGQALDGAVKLQRRHGIPFRVQVLEVSQRRYPLPRKTEINQNGRLVDLKSPLRAPIRARILADEGAFIEDLRKVVRDGLSVKELVKEYMEFEVPDTVSDLAAVCEVQES